MGCLDLGPWSIFLKYVDIFVFFMISILEFFNFCPCSPETNLLLRSEGKGGDPWIRFLEGLRIVVNIAPSLNKSLFFAFHKERGSMY